MAVHEVLLLVDLVRKTAGCFLFFIALAATLVVQPTNASTTSGVGTDGVGTENVIRTCMPSQFHNVDNQQFPPTSGCIDTLELFPLEALRPGLKGIGLTVVEGSSVQAFDVEILGELEGAGPVGSLILVRVSGEAIERSGGIAAGMSGSPVYVEGRLVGAIGYGFDMTDHRLGLVTPAEQMLELLHELETEGSESGEGEENDPPMRPGEGKPEPLDVLVTPLRTPVMVSGLGARSMQHLQRALKTYNVETIPAGRSIRPMEDGDDPLEPGSAIGVQLVRGDMDVTAIGTVTAIDAQGRFVAFGHPFLRKGMVDYMATTAHVVQTVPSLKFPFKLATPGRLIGTVSRDRGAGISGQVDASARTVSLIVRSVDADRNLEDRFAAEVVYDDSLIVSLLSVAALEGLDRSIDRIGRGTSWVELHLATKDSAREVRRENMYYSSSDVAALSLSDFSSALRMLQTNPFVEPDLERVELVARIEGTRKTAEIERAVPRTDKVALGESVEVEVTLRPYRSESIREVVTLPIPRNAGTGTVTVTVRGGEFAFAGSPFHSVPGGPIVGGEEETEEFEPQTPTGVESLEHLIAEFEEQPRNNDLIIEFYPAVEMGLAPEDSSGDFDGGHEVKGEPNSEESDPQASPWAPEAPDDDPEGPDQQGGPDTPEKDVEGASEDAEPAFSIPEDPYESVEPIRTMRSTAYVLRGESSFTLTLTAPR